MCPAEEDDFDDFDDDDFDDDFDDEEEFDDELDDEFDDELDAEEDEDVEDQDGFDDDEDLEDEPSTDMLQLSANIAEAAEAIRRRWQGAPRVGIILGTGLGSVAGQIRPEATFDYPSIPHFPRSTTPGHTGQWVCGCLQDVPVVAMEGRFHAYEGYSLRQITFPVRVMRALGAELLIVSNACGGLNPQYARGDIVVLEDHINLMNGNPLVGVNDDALGPRFPDMSAPYDRALIDRTLAIARRENFAAHKGVYVAVTGPNLETRAEYRFLRSIGADVVGMLTVPEVLVAVHAGMRVLGLSIVTDVCLPDALEPVDIRQILATAAEAEPKLRKIVLGILALVRPAAK